LLHVGAIDCSNCGGRWLDRAYARGLGWALFKAATAVTLRGAQISKVPINIWLGFGRAQRDGKGITVITVTTQASLTSRVGFATPGGRFKDFEMSRPFKVKQSILVAVLDAAQAMQPPVITVSVLYVTLMLAGGVFDPASPTLIIMALLSWLLLRPTQKRRSQLIPARVSAAIDVIVRWLLLLAIMGFIGKLDLEPSLSAYSGAVRLAWALTTPVFLLLGRLSVQHSRQLLLVSKVHRRSAVIAGYNAGGLTLARRLKRDPSMQLEVAGFFDERSESLVSVERDVKILGHLSQLGAFVKKHRTDLIFVALPNRDVQRVTELLDDLRDTTASIYYVPDSIAFDRMQPRSQQIHGVPVVAMSESPFYGFSGVGKRLTDIGLALLALIGLMPLILLVAAAVKLSSRGPLIERERRYGLDGRKITVYKFRTERSNDGNRSIDFLRRTSLVHLPLLINVLQGRLSLVGPQPHAVAHSDEYRKLVKGYMVRHKVLPGITGLAQVNGRRETGKIQDLQAYVDLDLDYLRHWSPMLDFKIMLMTLANFFRLAPVHR
jgi:putative colanic acid biosysnthesis UDP-glucose lipid carrier transferase